MANISRAGQNISAGHPLRQRMTENNDDGSKLRKQLRFLAVFFLTFLGAYGGYVALFYFSMPIQKKLLQNMLESSEEKLGQRDITPAASATPSYAIQIDRKCVPNYASRRINQNSPSSPLLAIQSHGSFDRMMNYGSWATNGWGPGAEVWPNEVVRYFNCAMTVQQERFCDKAERRRFAGQLADVHATRKLWLNTLKNSNADQRLDFGSQSSRPTMSVGALRNEIETLFDMIGPNLRYLAQVGYLDAGDFGTFSRVPEPISRHLVQKTQDRCRK